MGLDGVELVIRFEDAFGIAIPDEVAAQLTTPGKVTDYGLAELNSSNGPKGWSREHVASVVTEIIKDQLGREDFTEDSHFIDDLHLD